MVFWCVINDDIDVLCWLSFSGFVLVLCYFNGGICFVNVEEGIWMVECYLFLIVGELLCLCDDEIGYGLCGKDFIIYVDILCDIENVW